MAGCEWCDSPAVLAVTAAYRTLDYIGQAHPLWATYPAPMAHACPDHVGNAILADQAHQTASPGYLVVPL